VRRIHPAPEADLGDDELQAAYAFPDHRPWVRANMVSTLDGTMRGPDGSSRTISTPTDQRVFRLARRGADVILVGGRS
jgi:RibD C-terminal domain